MLDANISIRIEHLHRRQALGKPINAATPEMVRLRNLADSLPEGCVLITGFSAAEAETRRFASVPDLARYASRASAASVYLSDAKAYLRALLDGSPTGGLVIESNDDPDDPASFDFMRRWFTVSYAALLKAVAIDGEPDGTQLERLDNYRFWLEYSLKVSASREAWIGFMLLAGQPRERAKARRLLKLDAPGDLLDKVWGATWDLMYTRMPTFLTRPGYTHPAELPVSFVTDDEALVEALTGLTTVVGIINDHDVEFPGDKLELEVLDESVRSTVRKYIRREGLRVAKRSRGLTNQTLARARFEAKLLERLLHDASSSTVH